MLSKEQIIEFEKDKELNREKKLDKDKEKSLSELAKETIEKIDDVNDIVDFITILKQLAVTKTLTVGMI